MNREQHIFMVRSKTAPKVDIDFEGQSAYVRFKSASVAKTIARQTARMHVAVDVDSRNEVIGIEAVGFGELNLAKIVQIAKVETPNIDWSKTTFRPTPAMAGAS